jgi:transglutaminase-like putative cysteine protease
MGATLTQAIAAREALRLRYQRAPWLRGLGIGEHEHGYRVALRTSRPVGGLPRFVFGVPVHVVAEIAPPTILPPAAPVVEGPAVLGPPLPPGSAYGWRGAARWINFANREAKAAYMADAAGHDAHDPAVVAWARAFVGLPRPAREEAILRFAQRCLRYERDPAWFDPGGHRHGIEVLDSSAVALQRGYGDCDVKARLFVALCLATGVPAEIEPVFRGENGFPHVRARVRTPDGRRWQTADPTIVNSTIGKLPRHPLTAFPPEVEDRSLGGSV